MPSFQIKLAGQDITNYVEEKSIQISNALGQGAGVGHGQTGRASTCTFKTHLGPAASAVGAGSSITFPRLVRHGEIQIYDVAGTRIYGGYVGKLTDQTDLKTIYTQVDCYDYWQELDRITVNEVYDGQSDTFILKDLLTKYAPWIHQTKLPSASSYSFGPLKLRNMTLQKAIQKVVDVVGNQLWVDSNKFIYYMPPANAPVAPFSLAEHPDYISSQPCMLDKSNAYVGDDVSAINEVTFYGGKHLSQDFSQDLSVQLNGSSTIVTIAYYPHKCSDGKYHLYHNGTDLVIGEAGGTTDAKNKLKSDGGLADALLNADARNYTLNIAYANGGPNTLVAKYRYETPLVVIVPDTASQIFFGARFGGSISDETVFDAATAVRRCKTLLLEQSYGLRTIKITCWKSGLLIGQIIKIKHTTRQINGSYVIQKIDIKFLGGGKYQYDLEVGAWNWNMVDLFKTALAPAVDNSTDETTTTMLAFDQIENGAISSVFTQGPVHALPYYCRISAVGDTHDAYAGFCVCS